MPGAIRSSGTAIATGLLVAALIAYLLLWPIPVEPVVWQPSPIPETDDATATA